MLNICISILEDENGKVKFKSRWREDEKKNGEGGYVVKEETPALAHVSAKHKIILTQTTQDQRVPITFF